jgi:hypothetical protein
MAQGSGRCPHCSAPPNKGRFCHRCGRHQDSGELYDTDGAKDHAKAAGDAVSSAGRSPARVHCAHCASMVPPGGVYCPGCGVHVANAARLKSIYEEAAATVTSPTSSSGRGPTAAQRQALLDRLTPLSERIRRQERAVAIAEHDSHAANGQLRERLGDVQALLPQSRKISTATLDEAVQLAHRDVAGRALAPEAAGRYGALFDAADEWHRAEQVLQAARSRQNRLLAERDRPLPLGRADADENARNELPARWRTRLAAADERRARAEQNKRDWRRR